MAHAQMSLNLHIFQVAMYVTCALCVLLPFISAYSLPDSEVPPYFDDLNKRDVEEKPRLGTGGLGMQCQAHPRNCPGGIIFKRNRLLEALLRREPVDPLIDADSQTKARGIMAAGEDIRRSLRRLQNLMAQAQGLESSKGAENW